MNEIYHRPVLLAEVVRYLSLREGLIIVDATLGGGGHAEAILDGIKPTGILIGIDKDIAAINAARNTLARFSQQVFFVNDDFGNLLQILKGLERPKIDGILFDLGVSSHQLDNAARGFSYQVDVPLDMRMDTSQVVTAADIISSYSKRDLTRIFSRYGEEKWSSRIAGFIVSERERRPIATTFELVEIIKEAIPASARRTGGHPARRVFQALRIETNAELSVLRGAIMDASELLSGGGRMLVISYHSLEDRIVKNSFRELSRGCTCPPKAPICTCGREPMFEVLTRKPIEASKEEVDGNPRARSAKLRVIEKLK